MAIQTMAGTTPAQANANGLQGVKAGYPLIDTVYNGDQRDIQEGHVQALLAGVIAGGVCTASGLNVTIPNGTIYYARQVWQLTADVVISVPDAATTLLWGCCDGVIRQTASSFPSGYDGTNSCLIAQGTASGGTMTLAGGQHKGRQLDHTNRTVKDGPLLIDYANAVVDASAGALRIPSFSSDPSVPATGTYIWFNTSTNTAKVSVNGTVQPAVPPAQTIRFGSGAPSIGLGINGDVYFDTGSGNVYLKSAGSYGLQMNTATA